MSRAKSNNISPRSHSNNINTRKKLELIISPQYHKARILDNLYKNDLLMKNKVGSHNASPLK